MPSACTSVFDDSSGRPPRPVQMSVRDQVASTGRATGSPDSPRAGRSVAHAPYNVTLPYRFHKRPPLIRGRQDLGSLLASGGAVPAAGPGPPSPRMPHAAHPECEGERGPAPGAGIRKMHGGEVARPEGRADPRGPCRGAACDALPESTAFPAPVPGVAPASLPPGESARSPIPVRPMVGVGLPPPTPVPSPTPAPSRPPAPLPAPISCPRSARPRRHPRCRSRAGPADRRRAAAPAPPPGSGRPAGADLRAPPSLNPPGSPRRPLRPRCSGACGCRR